MYIDEKYKKNRYQRPSNDIHPDSKDEKWHLQYAEYIYSGELNGLSWIDPNIRDQFEENRKYSEGTQSPEKYKTYILGKRPQGRGEQGRRKAYTNINFNDILTVAPKFRDVVIGATEEYQYDPNVTALDENSGVDRENLKWKLWFEKEHGGTGGLIERTARITGMPVQKSDFVPESKHELELFEQMSGFKLPVEIAMEQLLKSTEKISEETEVSRSVREDLYDNNVACTKDVVDPLTQAVKYEYRDPAKLIVIGGGGRKDKTFKKATAFGYLVYYTPQDLREFGMEEEDIQNYLFDHKDSHSFSQYNDILSGDGWKTSDEQNRYAYDDILAPVLECEMLTTDVYNRTKITRKDGGSFTFTEKPRKTTLGDGSVIDIPSRNYDTDKKKTKTVNLKVWRKATWLIGSEFVWDYGLVDDMKRPGKWDADSSYNLYQIPGISRSRRIVPLIDSIALTWIRYQDLKARGTNNGIAIEWTALKNMELGGKKMMPLEILKMFTQTDRLIYKATTHKGSYNNPNAGKPIQEVKGSYGVDAIRTVMNDFDISLSLIREISGVNEVVAASSPNPESGLGQDKLAVSATHNTLKTFVLAYKALYTNTIKSCALRLQVVSKHKKGDQYYERVIGKTLWNAIKIASKMPLFGYGIYVDSLPTQQEIGEIKETLAAAMAPGKDGVSMIDTDDVFAIQRMISAGTSLGLIQVFIAMKIQKKRKQQLQVQKENMLLDQKGQKETASLKVKLEKDQKTHETNEEIKLEAYKAYFKDLAEDKGASRELKRMLTEKGWEAGIASVEAKQQAQQQAQQPVQSAV